MSQRIKGRELLLKSNHCMEESKASLESPGERPKKKLCPLRYHKMQMEQEPTE